MRCLTAIPRLPQSQHRKHVRRCDIPPDTIIPVLAGAVATLAGAFAATYRDQLSRADARIARQEAREDELLTTMHATITQLALTVAAMNEAQGKVTAYITEQSIIDRERDRQERVSERARDRAQRSADRARDGARGGS